MTFHTSIKAGLVTFACVLSSIAYSAPAEPSRDEVLAAIQAEITSHKEDFDMAIEAQRGNKLCNIWGYLEPVDFTIVDKALAADKVQYKMTVVLKWKADMEVIRTKDKCVGNSYVDMLGMPKKDAPAGGVAYKRPISLTLGKFDKGWRLLDI